MYPVLFEYYGFKITSYGFMLMSAFLISNYLLKKYLKSININPKIGDDLIFYAAIGGILISGTVGKYLNAKHIFSERVNGKMIFKRGFNIEPKQNILIVEDIVTTGGSINEIIKLVEEYDASIIGIVSIVDRNDKLQIFKYPYETLLNFPVQSWQEDNCPECKNNIEITKPGSTGKK